MGIWEGNSPNRNNVEIVNEPEQLIENNIINNFEQININKSPQLKTIIKVKNPFYLLKETFHLEKDVNKNIYYIKFKYDSLINFNCYINFNVKKNEQRNNIKIKDDYELCYIPTDKFVEKNIVVKNLPKGKNQDFKNEKAVLDFDYLEQNTTRRKEEYVEYEEEEEEEDDDIGSNNNNNIIEEVNNENHNEEINHLINSNNFNNKKENSEVNKDNINNNELEEYEEIFDIGIEFIPYYEKDSKEFNQNKSNEELILISLFNIEKKENNELDIKCVSQKLKKHNYFFELKDIYDGAGANGKCVICYSNNRNTIFINCRHSCCCQNCSNTLNPKICPLCKENIQDIIFLYKDIDNNTKNNDIEENKSIDENIQIQSINEI